jgi:tetratricopeptide (TPR) repeat protein
MMMEQHYDEEVLAGFLAEPIDSATRDKHLSSCALCQRTLDSLRGTASLLKEADVWQPSSFSATPRRETLLFLREVQKTMGDEEAAANVYIKQLLAGPRETWAAKLEKHPEWRTAGVVRKLIAAAVNATDMMPPDALEITRMLVGIAGSLTSDDYPESILAHLRFASLLERAFALMYTGSYVEALATIATADTLRSGGSEFDRARLDLVRVRVYQALERRDEALAISHAAASVFQEYGDFARYVAARCAEAITFYHARQFQQALAIHERLAFDERVEPRWRASSLHNAALCYRELGEFDKSIQYTIQAIEAFDREQMVSHRVKSRWNLARLLAAQQRHADALRIFPEIQEEFRDLGMAVDVALVAVDRAESLLMLDRIHEIPDACKTAIEYFKSAKLAYTEGALLALATLREAAARSTLTATAVRDFRTFLERLPHEPHLLYLSPQN